MSTSHKRYCLKGTILQLGLHVWESVLELCEYLVIDITVTFIPH